MSAAAPGAGGLVTAPSRLMSAPINLAALREDAWKELSGIFDTLEGTSIALVIDPSLEGPLKLVVTEGTKMLREHRVDSVVTLEDPVLYTDADTVMYLCRPAPHLVRLAAQQAKAFTRRGQRKRCHVVLTPRRTLTCETVLQEEGVWLPNSGAAGSSAGGLQAAAAAAAAAAGSAASASSVGGGAVVTMGEYSGLDILPLDDDVLTLHSETDLADVTACGDTAALYAMTQALMKIQTVFGTFPRIRAKGPLAGAVVNLMLRMRREEVNVANASRGIGLSGSSGSGSAGAAAAAAGGGGGSGLGAGGAAAAAAAGGGGGGGAAGAVDSSAASVSAAGFNLDRASADTRAYTAQVTLPCPTTGARGGASGSGATSSGVAAGVPLAVPPTSDIDLCIVMDRCVDMVTPLVSPLTYEGLLDDVFGLHCGMSTLDSALVMDDEDEGAGASSSSKRGAAAVAATRPPTTTLHFNSNAKLYAELRDCNFTVAGPKLQARARELQAMRDSMTKSRAADLKISDIKRFVKNMPGLQADLKLLKVLVNVTAELQKTTADDAFRQRWELERSIIDDDNKAGVADSLAASISRSAPLKPTLKALCLQSIVEGGLKQKVLDQYRRSLVQCYGFDIVPSLRALEVAGLLKAKREGDGAGSLFSVGSSSTPWSQVRKTLALTVDNAEVEEPVDLHYVTSGYAPLSIRLVQAALGLLGLPEALATREGGIAAAGGAGSRAGGAGGAAGGGTTSSSAATSAAAAAVLAAIPGGGSWDFGPVFETMKNVPGPMWNVVQNVQTAAAATAGEPASVVITLSGTAGTGAAASGAGGATPAGAAGGGAAGAAAGRERKVVLLAMFGGITHMELSCLRFLAEHAPVDFVVLTSAVTNGTRLISTLVMPPGNGLGHGGGSGVDSASGSSSTSASAGAASTAAGASSSGGGGGGGGVKNPFGGSSAAAPASPPSAAAPAPASNPFAAAFLRS